MTGEYTTQATLVDLDTETVVLKKSSGRLIALPIAKLSKADQGYLKSQNAGEIYQAHCAGNRTWVLRDGTKLAVRVVSYARRKLARLREMGNSDAGAFPCLRTKKLGTGSVFGSLDAAFP